MTVSVPQSTAITIVRVKAPWWAPRFVITGRFVDSIPEYAGVRPALDLSPRFALCFFFASKSGEHSPLTAHARQLAVSSTTRRSGPR